MNVISIDGVEYVKAGIIAKQYKYTADYVGQLCRGRKVDAKLVGRTWYVNPLSLTSHKTTRYVKESQEESDEKTMDDNIKLEASRLAVLPVVRKSSLKVSQGTSVAPANFLKRVEWQPLKYEIDEAELNPDPKHLESPFNLNVNLAESTSIKINSAKSETKLEAEPLPEISLRGKLSLSSLDVDFDLNEENIASSDLDQLEVESETEAGYKVKLKKLEQPAIKKQTKISNSGEEISESDATYSVLIKEVPEKSSLAFTPVRLRGRVLSGQYPVEDFNAKQSWWPVLLIILLGTFVTLGVLFIEFDISATSEIFTPRLHFSFSTF